MAAGEIRRRGLARLATPGQGRGTQELFEFYLLERFLYRLTLSLGTVIARCSRAVSCSRSLASAVREVAGIAVDDGMTFDVSPATIRASSAGTPQQGSGKGDDEFTSVLRPGLS
jgi:hypothetical protein